MIAANECGFRRRSGDGSRMVVRVRCYGGRGGGRLIDGNEFCRKSTGFLRDILFTSVYITNTYKSYIILILCPMCVCVLYV